MIRTGPDRPASFGHRRRGSLHRKHRRGGDRVRGLRAGRHLFNRHHRRRLVQSAFLSDLALRLQPGGCVEIATDHEGYAGWIDQALAAEPLLENVHTPEPFLQEVPGRMRTAYELEWLKEGRPLYYWTYRRRRSW